MSKIEWTEKTWNPVVGCRPISPGCANCYAEQMSGRCAAMGNADYAGLTRRGANGKTYLFTGDFRELPDRLDEPLRRKKPTTYFVNSMSDLFGEGVSNEFVAAVFGVMAACPQHTFQVLTKRADRMAQWFYWAYNSTCHGGYDTAAITRRMMMHASDIAELKYVDDLGLGSLERWPLANVCLGVSVEDRKHGLPRINELRKVPASVRFLSIEPLLEDLGTIDLTGIHWVIVGGESGTNARPMHPDWARSIRDQCVAAGVPFFFKQWGEWGPDVNMKAPLRRLRNVDTSGRMHSIADFVHGAVAMERKGKTLAGRILDGRTWDEMPK